MPFRELIFFKKQLSGNPTKNGKPCVDLDGLRVNSLFFWFQWGLFFSCRGYIFLFLFSFVTLSCFFQDHVFSSLNACSTPTFLPWIHWLAQLVKRDSRGRRSTREENLWSASGKGRWGRKESPSHFYFNKLHSSTSLGSFDFPLFGREMRKG